MPGPLQGYKVIELAGIGPGPFAALLLSDLGAEVVRVDRPVSRPTPEAPPDVLNRGRRSVAVDLKHPEGREVVLRLIEGADALLEGFRPGVTERLGLGPGDCHARNPRLVYGRMTGWGQDGPYAQMAGHDLNYIALSGVLSMIGPAGGAPVIPLNLVGDFGGGGLILALGVVSALLERERSGRGQVIDAAMVDGAALLGAAFWGLRAAGVWGERGVNLLDGGAPYYNVYETADGRYITFGSIEPQFYAELVERLGLDDADGELIGAQEDREGWPVLARRLATIARQRTRDEWCELLEGTDVCFAPVLTPEEAPTHPHLSHRGTFVEVDGVVQPGPAPRFDRTPAQVAGRSSMPGRETDEVLVAWGFSTQEIEALHGTGAIAGSEPAS
jgi:alpha-methylacyl-CoA racemase